MLEFILFAVLSIFGVLPIIIEEMGCFMGLLYLMVILLVIFSVLSSGGL